VRMNPEKHKDLALHVSTAEFMIEGHGRPCPNVFRVDDGDGTDRN